MSLRVTGMGTALPRHSISQADAARAWADLAGVDDKRARTIQALYRKSRINQRYSVLLEEGGNGSGPVQTFFEPAGSPEDPGPSTEARMLRYEADAPGMAAQAARVALADAGLEPSEITHLVTVSCTGFFAPGPDTAMVRLLELSPTVERTHVGFMGCHGALNGLRVASSFAGADPGARVLVSSVELCTLHMSYAWDPDLLVANSLFGDGAGAVVGVGRSNDSTDDPWRLASSGTRRLPESEDAMSWRIGDHGFHMTLSARVPEIIQSHLREWVEGWLGTQGLGRDEVKTWAVHPGGPRILSSVEEALEMDREHNRVPREILADHSAEPLADEVRSRLAEIIAQREKAAS